MYANLVVSPVGHHRITVLSREMLRDVTNRDATKTAENEERKIYIKNKISQNENSSSKMSQSVAT